MKKQILALLFAATATLNVADAQTMIGIKGGLNLSSFNFSADSLKNQFSPTNLKGYLFSIPIEIPIGKHWAIQTEIGFLQKGYKSFQNVRSGTSTLKTELEELRNYADVPFLLKMHRKLGPITIYGTAGPSFSYAMSGKQSGSVTTTPDNGGVPSATQVSGSVNFTDANGRWDYGINYGGGITVNVGIGKVALDGRFLDGLKNLKAIAANPGAATYSKGFATSLGYFIGF
jgi:Outer membrane protein beta-barrel domain